MATIYWTGTATAVAQVSTAQVTGNDAATTYKITIGGVVVSTTGNAGGAAATATDIAANCNASTHPYFAAITWSTSTDTVIGTADTAGCPFTFTATVAGGAGTFGAVSDTTANAGPNDWSTATNWSGGAVPVGDDVVIIKSNAVNICWGLAQSAVGLDGLMIEKSYTGRIGLDYATFATSADGATTDSTKAEYRDDYLAIEVTAADGPCEIGKHVGTGTAAGSSRIKLDLGSNPADVFIFGTSSTSADTGRPAIRLKADDVLTEIYVRSAPGGVGLAAEKPGETSSVALVSVSDTTTASKVVIGEGTTIVTYTQSGGANQFDAAATVTTMNVNGGTLTTEGDYTVTTVNVTGGTLYPNHTKTAGNAITTLNLKGGTVNARGSNLLRAWLTVQLWKGATIQADDDVLFITNMLEPDGPYTINVS